MKQIAAAAASRLGRTLGLGLAFAGLVFQAGPVLAAAGAGSIDWTLALDNTARSCRLTLRFEASGAAGELAMPLGCRRAVPAVKDARTWAMGSDSHIEFDDAKGRVVLAFAQQEGSGWHAIDGGGHGVTMTPVDAAQAAAVSAALSSDAAPPDDGPIIALTPQDPLAANPVETRATASVVAQAVPTKAATASMARGAAGRYAVMRGDRDTGCMVTLDSDARGPKNGFKARLAPACRDQGIIVFDPLGWQVEAGHLVLTARKGHTIRLDKDETGVWIKMPKDVKALGLKPL